MATVRSFRMPFDTSTFRKGQKVWVVFFSGAEAAECVGRFRGRGRCVRAWVRWGSVDKPEPIIAEFEVTDDFAERHGIADVKHSRSRSTT
jgi:hypothetical protein